MNFWKITKYIQLKNIYIEKWKEEEGTDVVRRVEYILVLWGDLIDLVGKSFNDTSIIPLHDISKFNPKSILFI